MPNDKDSIQRAPRFNHNDTSLTRDQKYKRFTDSLVTYLGATHSPYGSCGLYEPQETSWMWGLVTEFKLLLLENGWSKDSDQVGKWMKVQADILNVLQNNFRDHDDVILDLYRRDVIQRKLLKEFEQSSDFAAQETRYHRKLAWIP